MAACPDHEQPGGIGFGVVALIKRPIHFRGFQHAHHVVATVSRGVGPGGVPSIVAPTHLLASVPREHLDPLTQNPKRILFGLRDDDRGEVRVQGPQFNAGMLEVPILVEPLLAPVLLHRQASGGFRV